MDSGIDAACGVHQFALLCNKLRGLYGGRRELSAARAFSHLGSSITASLLCCRYQDQAPDRRHDDYSRRETAPHFYFASGL